MSIMSQSQTTNNRKMGRIPDSAEMAVINEAVESGDHIRAVELISHMISSHVHVSLETYLLAARKRILSTGAA